MTRGAETDLGTLVERARAAGVELWAEGERLRFRAPPGALADDMRDALRERREQVVRLLQREADERVLTGPMAANQQGLWLVQRLAPRNTAYDLAFSARVLSPVDAALVREALQILVDRHEALRTSYSEGPDGGPLRRVHGRAHLELTVDESPPDGSELRAAVEEAHGEPFDLEAPPLLRGHLFVGPGEESVLLIVGHHLAIDGQSLFLLVGEFFRIYGALAEGTPLPPADDSAEFGEFVEWQHRLLSSDPASGDYWQGVLTPPPPRIDIPADRPRSSTSQMEGGTVSFDLGGEASAALRALGRSCGATDYVVLLSAWTLWLSRITGAQDVTVGTPVHGRPAVRFERTIGDFVNMLPLRVQVDAAEGFGALVQGVRKATLEGMAHQDYPLPLMTAGYRGGTGPPFETTFVLQDFKRHGGLESFLLGDESERATFGGLTLAPFPLNQQEGQFPLALDAWSTGDGWAFNCRYDSALFDHETVERRMDEFGTLLHGIAADSTARVSDLPIVPPSDLALLTEWNATEAEVPAGTLVDLIAAQAERTPESQAVVAADGTYTYSELIAEAQRIGGALRGLGVRAGDRVGVLLNRDRELVAALLGILGVGAAYVPMDPRYPAARLRQMVEDSGAEALITNGGLEAELDAAVPVLDLAGWSGPEPEPFEAVDPKFAAYVIYTSGSTGRPKGVEVPHGAVVNFLRSMAKEPGLSREDVLLAVTTISFDIAVLELYLPLMVGARVVLAGEDEVGDGRRLAELMEREGVTVLQATPATWKLLVATGWEGKRDLKALCGGEALPASLADEVLERVGELWNLYGPTETTVWSTVQRIRVDEPIRIGRPIANTTVYVVDERGRRVPIGVPGELWIGGAGVTHGYVGRPDLTDERFLASPFREGERVYRTGDLVRWRAEGVLEHLGRLDHQVKVRGFRVEPGEIEARLRAHTSVGDVVVVAREDRLLAYVVGDAGADVDADVLRRWVAETLPSHMVPSVFVPLDALPLTPNGKVDRNALPDPDPGSGHEGDYAPPHTEVERMLAAIWEEVLEVDRVGRNDDFFRLGGHSLLVPTAMLLVRERLGVEVGLAELFQAPVLRDLSRRLEHVLARELRRPSTTTSGTEEADEVLVF